MKKLCSITLAFVLMLAMAVPAFAAETTQITVDGTGQAYKAWRLLNSVEVPSEEEGVPSTYTYSLNDEAHTAILLAALNITETDSAKQLSAIMSALGDMNDDSAEINAFAAAAFHAIETQGLDADAEAGADGKFGDVPQGYWLIAEVTAADSNDALSFLMLNTAGEDVMNPTAKPTEGTSIPTVDKKLDDTSKGTSAHNIGDVVGFVITATVPAAAAKYENAYEYTIHDKPVNLGILNNDDHAIIVKIDGEVVDEDVAVVTTSDNEDGCGLEVYIEDARGYAGKAITVTYDAEVLASAAAGFGANKNTVNVVFSNNPYGEDTGKTVPTDPEDPIPENEVVVLIYNVDLYNIISGTDSDDAPYSEETLLSGEFTLQKKNDDGEWVDVTTMGDDAQDTREDDPTQHRWLSLTDGDYRIVQDSAQAGYAAEDATEFVIKTAYDENGKPTGFDEAMEGSIVKATDFNAGEIDLVVPNATGSKLPSTGGAGTYAIYAVGVVCVIAALGAVVIVTKRRNKTEA